MSDCASSCSSPGARALAVVKKVEDLQIFKKPGLPVSRQVRRKQKVLDEDAYIEV